MKAILRIIRQSVERGQAVEIEGLGTFRKTEGGRYRLEPQTRPQVFVAYAVEDLIPARRLCEALEAAGCSPWLDKDKLLPGQNWRRSIETSDSKSRMFSWRVFRRDRSARGGNSRANCGRHWSAPASFRWIRYS